MSAENHLSNKKGAIEKHSVKVLAPVPSQFDISFTPQTTSRIENDQTDYTEWEQPQLQHILPSKKVRSHRNEDPVIILDKKRDKIQRFYENDEEQERKESIQTPTEELFSQDFFPEDGIRLSQPKKDRDEKSFEERIRQEAIMLSRRPQRQLRAKSAVSSPSRPRNDYQSDKKSSIFTSVPSATAAIGENRRTLFVPESPTADVYDDAIPTAVVPTLFAPSLDSKPRTTSTRPKHQRNISLSSECGASISFPATTTNTSSPPHLIPTSPSASSTTEVTFPSSTSVSSQQTSSSFPAFHASPLPLRVKKSQSYQSSALMPTTTSSFASSSAQPSQKISQLSFPSSSSQMTKGEYDYLSFQSPSDASPLVEESTAAVLMKQGVISDPLSLSGKWRKKVAAPPISADNSFEELEIDVPNNQLLSDEYQWIPSAALPQTPSSLNKPTSALTLYSASSIEASSASAKNPRMQFHSNQKPFMSSSISSSTTSTTTSSLQARSIKLFPIKESRRENPSHTVLPPPPQTAFWKRLMQQQEEQKYHRRLPSSGEDSEADCKYFNEPYTDNEPYLREGSSTRAFERKNGEYTKEKYFDGAEKGEIFDYGDADEVDQSDWENDDIVNYVRDIQEGRRDDRTTDGIHKIISPEKRRVDIERKKRAVWKKSVELGEKEQRADGNEEESMNREEKREVANREDGEALSTEEQRKRKRKRRHNRRHPQQLSNENRAILGLLGMGTDLENEEEKDDDFTSEYESTNADSMSETESTTISSQSEGLSILRKKNKTSRDKKEGDDPVGKTKGKAKRKVERKTGTTLEEDIAMAKKREAERRQELEKQKELRRQQEIELMEKLRQKVVAFDMCIERLQRETKFSQEQVAKLLATARDTGLLANTEIAPPLPARERKRLFERKGKTPTPSVLYGCFDVDAYLDPLHFSFFAEKLGMKNGLYCNYFYWNVVAAAQEMSKERGSSQSSTKAEERERMRKEESLSRGVQPVSLNLLLKWLDFDAKKKRESWDESTDAENKLREGNLGEEGVFDGASTVKYRIGKQTTTLNFLLPQKDEYDNSMLQEKSKNYAEIDEKQENAGKDGMDAHERVLLLQKRKAKLKEKEEFDLVKDDYSFPLDVGSFYLSLRSLLIVIGAVSVTARNTSATTAFLPSLSMFSSRTTRSDEATQLSSGLSNLKEYQSLPVEVALALCSRFYFRLLDWDQDSMISGSDLFNALSSLQSDVEEDDIAALTQAVFAEFDSDGDGKLSFEEFSRKGRSPPHKICVFVRDVFEGMNLELGDGHEANGKSEKIMTGSEDDNQRKSEEVSSLTTHKAKTSKQSSIHLSSGSDENGSKWNDNLENDRILIPADNFEPEIKQAFIEQDNEESTTQKQNSNDLSFSASSPNRDSKGLPFAGSPSLLRRSRKQSHRPSSPFRFDPNSDEYYGRWRLLNPDSCDPLTYRRKSGTKGISFVMAESKETGRDVILGILFDREIWSERDAAGWWASNRHRFRREWRGSMWAERGIDANKPLKQAYKKPLGEKKSITIEIPEAVEKVTQQKEQEKMLEIEERKKLEESSADAATTGSAKKKGRATPPVSPPAMLSISSSSSLLPLSPGLPPLSFETAAKKRKREKPGTPQISSMHRLVVVGSDHSGDSQSLAEAKQPLDVPSKQDTTKKEQAQNHLLRPAAHRLGRKSSVSSVRPSTRSSSVSSNGNDISRHRSLTPSRPSSVLSTPSSIFQQASEQTHQNTALMKPKPKPKKVVAFSSAFIRNS
ncbi:uncharacterized protein MONOS_3967 [Monocercomonoides exilis]|uniref:uncharacterized protein n=1 Tax=Monocercomonoides exilis TaxID=2049356 RepID=UPI00355A0713|nr:hypothetical protein MONOS_3967 [Monocercomonoides exilis]|eukprot:MONOS_3967.1-p1 / transcript=MONOS_3967.1 / gene=MONOS_3967 / organism=Monocercomonoides_exilis_PA203 / gene_product=unspecified product / transcript_product=unspecified product / location=Mono_scaffold00099:72033-77515(+) / protein_length=1751 / sequence_SO=supercontig / SO=protein_coding / is_pseudo=false